MPSMLHVLYVVLVIRYVLFTTRLHGWTQAIDLPKCFESDFMYIFKAFKECECIFFSCCHKFL